MRFKSATFATSAKNLAACPDWALPEIAFIGRSNVGKSSIINLLASQAGLAKVSATPGKTRLLNFFIMDEKWALVDLPGYGYAKIAKEEKVDFNESVGDYLALRPHLVHLYVLIDSRLEPQRIDLDFLQWRAAASPVPFSLIFTKTDKQSPGKTKANIQVFLDALAQAVPDAPVPETFTSSTKQPATRPEILRHIQSRLAGA